MKPSERFGQLFKEEQEIVRVAMFGQDYRPTLDENRQAIAALAHSRALWRLLDEEHERRQQEQEARGRYLHFVAAIGFASLGQTQLAGEALEKAGVSFPKWIVPCLGIQPGVDHVLKLAKEAGLA